MGGDFHLKGFKGAGRTFTLRIPMYSSAGLPAAGSSQRCGRPRSIIRSRSKAHTTTTTRSLSAFSSVAFSGRSTHEAPTVPDGNMRLVGLSQPSFVQSRAKSMNDYRMAVQADATARSGDGADKEAGKQVQHHPATHPPIDAGH
jgi:hypothetical protein